MLRLLRLLRLFLSPLVASMAKFPALLLSLFVASSAWAAGTPVVTDLGTVGGRAQLLVTVTETSQRDTSEVTITGLPRCGTIVVYRAALTAGTGTTIHPRLGTSASFVADGADEVLEATSTASVINEAGSAPYCTASGTLYLRSAPNNTATDHSITTRFVVVSGAQQ